MRRRGPNSRRPGNVGQKTWPRGVGLDQAKIHRYNKAAARKPSMSALKRLALALGVTIDELVFDDGERGPDDDLRLQFDAVSQFAPEEKRVAKELPDSLILKHQARRWTGTG